MANVSWLNAAVQLKGQERERPTLRVMTMVYTLVESAAVAMWDIHAKAMVALSMRGITRFSEVVKEIHEHNDKEVTQIEISESGDRFLLTYRHTVVVIEQQRDYSDHALRLIARELENLLTEARGDIRHKVA